MMDILMSETCWIHKKWNKIASDIKLVFYSSTKPFHVIIYFKKIYNETKIFNGFKNYLQADIRTKIWT